MRRISILINLYEQMEQNTFKDNSQVALIFSRTVFVLPWNCSHL